MKKRLDLFLVSEHQISSRTKAQDLIKSGSVWIFEKDQWRQATAPSRPVEEGARIEIRQSELDRYVSRGGLKLEGALRDLKLSVSGLEVLDVGMSTGGFTDCLLQHGARRVVGVDVGHAQLHPRLKDHPQVHSIEGVNARDLHLNSQVRGQMPQSGWPFIVVDVSFISLTLILPALKEVLGTKGCILALVKPQFEVGPDGLGKGGVVKDSSLYAEVEKKIRQKCLELDLTVGDYLNSSIEGKDGNREFFILAQKK